MGPKCHHKCPYEREAKGDTDIQGGEEVKTEPRNADSHQKLEGARTGFSSRAFGGNVALLTSGFQASGLQNGERVSVLF